MLKDQQESHQQQLASFLAANAALCKENATLRKAVVAALVTQLGLPHNSKTTDRGNPVCPCIWGQGIEFGLEPLRTSDTSELSQDLDEAEEKRDRPFRRKAKLVKPRDFHKGDLVLRRTFEEGKLKRNWEGPLHHCRRWLRRGLQNTIPVWKDGASPLELGLSKEVFSVTPRCTGMYIVVLLGE